MEIGNKCSFPSRMKSEIEIETHRGWFSGGSG